MCNDTSSFPEIVFFGTQFYPAEWLCSFSRDPVLDYLSSHVQMIFRTPWSHLPMTIQNCFHTAVSLEKSTWFFRISWFPSEKYVYLYIWFSGNILNGISETIELRSPATKFVNSLLLEIGFSGFRLEYKYRVSVICKDRQRLFSIEKRVSVSVASMIGNTSFSMTLHLVWEATNDPLRNANWSCVSWFGSSSKSSAGMCVKLSPQWECDASVIETTRKITIQKWEAVASTLDDHLKAKAWIERNMRYAYSLDSIALKTIIRRRLLNLLAHKGKISEIPWKNPVRHELEIGNLSRACQWSCPPS